MKQAELLKAMEARAKADFITRAFLLLAEDAKGIEGFMSAAKRAAFSNSKKDRANLDSIASELELLYGYIVAPTFEDGEGEE